MMFHINLTFNHAIRGKSSLFLLPGLRGPIVQITLAFIVFIFFFLSFFSASVAPICVVAYNKIK